MSVKSKSIIFLTGTLALLLSACSTTPKTFDELEQARELVAELNREPLAEPVAGEELLQAEQALRRAETLAAERGDRDDILHLSYVASRHAQIAFERIAEYEAREAIEKAEAERTEILLVARANEAERAELKALSSAAEAELARRAAEVNAVEAERARQQAAREAREKDLALLAAEEQRREAEARALEAEAARQAADIALAEANRLAAELESLKAEQTSRGLVLTLSDVLFDVDRADLKPGAELTMERLAAFMLDHLERQILIEGHTDAQGDDAYNESLSQRRAATVANALVASGIDEDRIKTVGLGERFPVAGNDTPAGRQQNRRVEIVISDPEGDFPPSAHRGIAAN